MSKIISIGTALPPYRHRQMDILAFMLNVYQPEAGDRRKIALLYERSGIEARYSAIPDYSGKLSDRSFYPGTSDMEPFPALEKRMELYQENATDLSIRSIENCIKDRINKKEITCLITVSCTGMSAPGLDISILQKMQLSPNIQRSSVNFMGCYAALHALKAADAICKADKEARVVIVCTELCTLHFQKESDMDSIASSLLFGDGAAAVLVTGDSYAGKGLFLKGFYSEVALQGHDDMAWHLSSRGFLMRLSAYIPKLIGESITPLLHNALAAAGISKEKVTRWAIHPGGKKILDTIQQELLLQKDDLAASYKILNDYGNMSSPTVLFVLKEIMENLKSNSEKIFMAAFGPGITLETLILEQ
ncbi:MAG: type III polyketide synthase [Chitinophagaceae bacterium]|nr:type III polyketide synthase [Chitinophagaceae bacterium]